MDLGLGLGALLALLLGVALRVRSDGPRWPVLFHGVISIASLTLLVGSAMHVFVFDPLVAALAAASSLMSLPIPTDGHGHFGASGVAIGPAAAAALLAAVGLPERSMVGADATTLSLLVGAGALCALALGFALRALSRARLATPSTGFSVGIPIMSGAVAAFAHAAMGAMAGDPTRLVLPVAGQGEAPALWMTNINAGLQATVDVPEAGGVLLAGAALALISGFLPGRRIASGAAGLSGLALAGVAIWMIATHGTAVELDAELVRGLLTPLVADPSLAESPRLLTPGPYHMAPFIAALPLAALMAAGFGAIGHAVDRHRDPAELADRPAALFALGTRDAFQVGAILLWGATTLFLVHQHHVFGIWGPHSPAEDVMVAAAFSTSAAVAGLHALGSGRGRWSAAIRAAVVGIAAALLVATISGGLVGAEGVFGL